LDFVVVFQPGDFFILILGVDFVAQVSNTLGDENAGPKVGPLVISEIMYHPPRLVFGGQSFENGRDEFIELHNISGQALDLWDPNATTNTWRLRDAVSYSFPLNTTLAADEHVLVVSFDPADAAERTRFLAVYGNPTVRLFGPWGGQLNNAGESVELVQPDVIRFYVTNIVVTGVLIDKVVYEPVPQWPAAADGYGPSLQRKSDTAYGDDPANWAAAGPSPGVGYTAGPPPVITKQPVSQTVLAYSVTTLSVEVIGPGPYQFQWLKDGQPLPGEVDAMLTLTDTQPGDAGRYSVIVQNASAAVSSSPATLTVVIPAHIITQPQDLALPAGEDATFQVVVAEHTPPISYQWYKNDILMIGQTSPTLVLSDVGYSDNGAYRVVVTDAVGPVSSRTATFQVLIAPEYVQGVVPTTGYVGGSVIFSVTVTNTATLPITNKWKQGSAELAVRQITPYTDFLVLSNLTLAQNNQFINVAAANPAGTGHLSYARLTVLAAPPADSDGDGMPDSYEDANGLNKNLNDYDLDKDGDGFTNGEEFEAGTDPDSASSYLRVESIADPGVISIRFEAVAGKTYAVEYREAVEDGAWQLLTGVAAGSTTRMVEVFDTLPPLEGKRFYRLVTPGVTLP